MEIEIVTGSDGITHRIILPMKQEVRAGEVITDHNGIDYKVVVSVNWQTHIELFVEKV